MDERVSRVREAEEAGVLRTGLCDTRRNCGGMWLVSAIALRLHREGNTKNLKGEVWEREGRWRCDMSSLAPLDSSRRPAELFLE
jgi:hypothetical protein